MRGLGCPVRIVLSAGQAGDAPHALRKIEQKVVRTDDHPRLWHHCIWFAHVFDHPVRQGRAPARFDRFYHTDY